MLKNLSDLFNKYFLLIVLSALVTAFFSLESQATVRKVKPTMLFEGETITVLGTKLKSKSNATKAQLFDGEGVQFGSDLEIVSQTAKGFKVIAPSVAATKTLVLQVSGGNVAEDDAQDFPIVIFNAPDLSSPDPSPPDEDINVENVNAESVIFENLNLNASSAGVLQWNGNSLINAEGYVVTNRVTLNGIALETSNGNITWNSHTLATAGGALTASSLASEGSKSGIMTFNGDSNVTVISGNGDGELHLPPQGQLLGVLRAEYDFTVDGGTTGTKALRNATIPTGARVTRAWYEVTTTFQSATDATTISLGIATDDSAGILSAIAINDGTNPWDQGAHMCIQNGNLSHISELTQDQRGLEMVVAGEALTAGSLVLFTEYMQLP